MDTSVWLETATLASVHVLAVLGLYVQVISGQLNLGQAAFVGLGAYASAYITTELEFPFPVALIAAVLAGAVFAALFGWLVLRLANFFYAVATLGLSFTIVVVIQNVDILGGARGMVGIPMSVSREMIFGALVLVILWMWMLDRSHLMRALRACGDDPAAVSAIGGNPGHLRIIASAISGALAGLAGALYAHYMTVLFAETFGFAHSLDYLIFVMVGGATIFLGPIIGGFVLLGLPELLRFSSNDSHILYGLILVLIMVLRPKGLVSRRVGSFRRKRQRASPAEKIGDRDVLTGQL